MDLRFTNHAQYRLQERKISVSDVKLTVKKADCYGYAFEDKTIARKTINGKILEVVYVKENNKILVITAYYL